MFCLPLLRFSGYWGDPLLLSPCYHRLPYGRSILWGLLFDYPNFARATITDVWGHTFTFSERQITSFAENFIGHLFHQYPTTQERCLVHAPVVHHGPGSEDPRVEIGSIGMDSF